MPTERELLDSMADIETQRARAYADHLQQNAGILAKKVGEGPMPTFTLNASDVLAYPLVVNYARACRDFGLEDQAQKVSEIAEAFRNWLSFNPGEVRLPDYRHVDMPAAKTGEGVEE